MKKIANVILTSIYIFILFLLAIFMFWEAYGKQEIKKYIDKQYGNAINQTRNNSELIIKLLNIEEDES